MQPEAFLTHQVFEKLEQLNQALSSNENREKLPLENIQFFEVVYNHVIDRLHSTVPLLVQEPELASLAAEIDAANVQIIAYLGNKNIGHLNNAVNNLNAVLNRTRNIPLPLSSDNYDFAKHVANFEKAVNGAYSQLNTYAQTIDQKLIDTEKELAVKETKIQELTQKLAEKETEIQTVLTRYNSEFETLKTTSNAAIEADRKKFTEDFESDRKSFTSLNTDDRKVFQTELETQVKKSSALVNDHLSKMNGKLEEAKKIVNIIGNVGVTGNYQIIANQHRKNANNLRYTAFFFMGLMSVLLIWSIIDLGNGDFNFYKSIVRVLAAAVLTYPAIYASRESTRHRNLETRNRNLELELASVGPFIELLPETEQQKIKQELVKKYFGNHLSDEEDKKTGDEDVSVNALDKLLKTILPFMKK